jgi:nitroreductase
VNTVIETIKTRRSIRAYSDRPVARELIARVLEAATYAPSASNRQWWRITAVSSQATIDRFTAAIAAANARKGQAVREGWRFGFGAPVVILISMPQDYSAAPWDAGCAGEALFLAAWSLGLGTCWFGALGGSMSEEPEVRALLDEIGVPVNHTVHVSTPLGYPAEQKAAGPRAEGATAIVD